MVLLLLTALESTQKKTARPAKLYIYRTATLKRPKSIVC